MKDTAHVGNLIKILNRIKELEDFINVYSDTKDLRLVLAVEDENNGLRTAFAMSDGTPMFVAVVDTVNKEIARLCGRVESIVNDHDYPANGCVVQLKDGDI